MKDLDTSFFNPRTIKLPVRSGHLLVAQPFLDEVWFSRAVISVIDYDKEVGATGVVLNNNMNYTLAEVLDGVNDRGREVPVFCGGPLCQDRLYFIHTLGPEIIPGTRHYAPGLYIGGDFDHAVSYINTGYPADGMIRFFIGYTGWSGGQLEKEIESNTWAVVPGGYDPSDILTSQGAPFWHRTVRAMGPSYRSWQFIPADIRAN